MAIRRVRPRHASALVVVAIAIAILAGAPAAHADCGFGPPFALGFGKSPRLLPTLHATENLDCGDADGREYDYVAKGYFKVAGRTVARLPSFTGHVNATHEHLTLTVKRSIRHTIRAAAARRGARRTTLTLVYRITQTNTIQGDLASPAVPTYAEDAFLTIPRN
jgi:hypothetical protein